MIQQVEPNVILVRHPAGIGDRPLRVAAHGEQHTERFQRFVCGDVRPIRRHVWVGQIPQFIGGRSVVEDRFHSESIADIRHVADCAAARRICGRAVRGVGGDKGAPLPQDAGWAKARQGCAGQQRLVLGATR